MKMRNLEKIKKQLDEMAESLEDRSADIDGETDLQNAKIEFFDAGADLLRTAYDSLEELSDLSVDDFK